MQKAKTEGGNLGFPIPAPQQSRDGARRTRVWGHPGLHKTEQQMEGSPDAETGMRLLGHDAVMAEKVLQPLGGFVRT